MTSFEKQTKKMHHLFFLSNRIRVFFAFFQQGRSRMGLGNQFSLLRGDLKTFREIRIGQLLQAETYFFFYQDSRIKKNSGCVPVVDF